MNDPNCCVLPLPQNRFIEHANEAVFQGGLVQLEKLGKVDSETMDIVSDNWVASSWKEGLIYWYVWRVANVKKMTQIAHHDGTFINVIQIAIYCERILWELWWN